METTIPDGLIPLQSSEELTERESQVLYQIRTLQYELRESPKVSDLSDIFGVSPGRMKRIIQALVNKGFIEWSKRKDWRHKSILFPRGMKFPWTDGTQFPPDIFNPR